MWGLGLKQRHAAIEKLEAVDTSGSSAVSGGPPNVGLLDRAKAFAADDKAGKLDIAAWRAYLMDLSERGEIHYEGCFF